MEYIIWGAGEYGQRILFHVGAENVLAFIDSDKEKIGKKLQGKVIIDYDTYKSNYSDVCIIVSTHESMIIEMLEKDNIKKYFRLSDCPDDLRSPYLRSDLKQYICSRVENEKIYIIYGKSLFSIIVFNWIKGRTIKGPYLLFPSDFNAELQKVIKEEYKERVINDLELENFDFDKILNVNKRNETNILNIKPNKIENVLDDFQKTDIYYNPAIEKFKNIHNGKRCFIVATGPSLTIKDLDILEEKKEFCISMNRIFHAFSNTVWRPQYYVADDYRMMRDYPEAIDYMTEGYSFIGDVYQPFCEQVHPANVLIHHLNVAWNEEMPPFSEDFARMCYPAGTVTYSCIQLAVYMGFKEIYLLGVDFTCADKEGAKYGHFYEEKELTAIGRTEFTKLAYISAKKYADEHGIKIYNATRGGKLEIFERVNFNHLF